MNGRRSLDSKAEQQGVWPLRNVARAEKRHTLVVLGAAVLACVLQWPLDARELRVCSLLFLMSILEGS